MYCMYCKTRPVHTTKLRSDGHPSMPHLFHHSILHLQQIWTVKVQRKPQPAQQNQTLARQGSRDWRLLGDLNQRLCFPPEFATTNLRPDLVLWSPSLQKVYMTELTVLYEDVVEEAYFKCTQLAADPCLPSGGSVLAAREDAQRASLL